MTLETYPWKINEDYSMVNLRKYNELLTDAMKLVEALNEAEHCLTTRWPFDRDKLVKSISEDVEAFKSKYGDK